MTDAPTQLGKYRLERELGAGGMGTVWLAHDTELDRKVALKVLRPALAGDDTAQARLLREARAMAKLRHPNVITVFDAETIGGRDLVAMELVEGSNMAAWLASEHTEDEVIAALLAAGRGLAAAHAAGMVHRDFKPHNVLVERGGRVLVTDFGLARAEIATTDPLAVTALPEPRPLALEETAASTPARPVEVTATLPSSSRGSLDSDLTRTGTLLGTPAYMAPEQLRGAPADARADQFAFCVTAWEALAGKRPFPGDDLAAIAKAIEAGVPAFADRVPRRLRPILARGLAKDPAARWPGMDPLLDALERAWRRPRKLRSWGLGVGIGIVTFVGIFVIMSSLGRHPGSAATTPACSGKDALAVMWSPAVRDKLAAQLGKDGTHALAALDRWAAAWTKVYDANCANPTDTDYSIRTICLESQRDSIDLLVHPPDADAAQAVASSDLALMLPPPEACQAAPRVIAPPPPKDPAVRARVQKLHSLLLALRTKIFDRDAAGQDALLAKADAAIREAEGTGDPTVRSEALGLRALVLAFARGSETGDRNPRLAEAYQALKEAGEAAEAAGNDRVRVQLLVGQLEMASGIPGFWADLDDLMHRAQVGVEHVKDPIATLMFEELKATIAMTRGAWTAAIDGFEHVRQAWLGRGSEEMFARFTALEAETLMMRHAGDDLSRAQVILEDADQHDLHPASHRLLAFVHALITGTAGTATAMEARMISATATTGAPGPGSLTVSVATAPSVTDDPDARVTRRAPPDVFVIHGKDRWHVLPAAIDRFALSGLAPGRYQVEIVVSSALGDLETIRREVDVRGATPLSLDLPAAHEVARRFGPTTGEALWGVAVAVPGKIHPATVGALRPLLDRAPWWSAAWVHTVRDGATVVLAAELGAMSDPMTVCTVKGATLSQMSIDVTFGPDDRPVQCE